ncbi:HECT-like ubiquitin-conjugating enzyme-binding-domain-containing protein [Entophlyctis helioformis]|nr:HECT-like ubiquitin-conjugating enzyme-binding-domain-containing protein [Entophlyctis helioformis]
MPSPPSSRPSSRPSSPSALLLEPAAHGQQQPAHADMAQWRSTSALSCRNCCALLTQDPAPAAQPASAHQPPLFKRCLRLPSQHWHEMLECWACHHEDYSSTLKGQQGGLIFAQQHSLMVGDSHLLLHPSDLRLDRLRIAYNGSESILRSARWIQVQCDRCRAPVGECFMDREAASDSVDMSQVQMIRLAKYRVDAMLWTGCVLQTPFVECFVSELLDACQAHATYRFYVHDEDSRPDDGSVAPPSLFLWLFAPHVEVGRMYGDGKGSCAMFPAVKILYQVLTSGAREPVDGQGSAAAQNGHACEADGPGKAETVHLAGDLIAQLLHVLQASTAAHVPPHEQVLFGHSLGILPRCPSE